MTNDQLIPFSTNVPLLYPLKTSEDLRFSDVFRGYRSGTLAENGLNNSLKILVFQRFFTVLILMQNILKKVYEDTILVVTSFRASMHESQK